MTESNVIYIAPNRTDAGAVPKGTNVATHDRTSDGAEVQDVYIDNIPADGYVSDGNSTEVNLAGGATFEGTFDSALEYGAVTFGTIGTTYPVKAIRKQSAQRDIAIFIEYLYMFLTTANDQAVWTLQINPTLSAPLTYANVTNSAAQEASGNGTITVTTEGTVLAAGAISTNGVLPTDILKLNFLAALGSTIANVMDEYVLCITPITANITAHSGISYDEI